MSHSKVPQQPLSLPEPDYEPDEQDFADLEAAEAAFAAGDFIDHQEMMDQIEARIEAISAERSKPKPSP